MFRKLVTIFFLLSLLTSAGAWAVSYHGLEIRRHVMYGDAGAEFSAVDGVDDILCFLDGIAYLHVASPFGWKQDAEAEVSQEFPLDVRETATSWALRASR